MANDGDLWTYDEVRAAVAAYIEMLELEQAGTKYSKSTFNEQLRAGPLSDRSKASVERRMCNISSVLRDRGEPHIAGYKPLEHVGPRATDMVEKALRELRGH